MQEKDNSGFLWFLGLGAVSVFVYLATRSEPKTKVVVSTMPRVDTSRNSGAPDGRPPGAAPLATPLTRVPTPNA